jgi:hypothetical protein
MQVVNALLNQNADASVADAYGKNAVAAAKARGHDAIARLIEPRLAQAQTAAQRQPPVRLSTPAFNSNGR